MDLSIRTESYQTGDHSWLASQHGVDIGATGTLDISGFTAGTHYPNGYIPSGLVLGQLSASGMWVPYDDAAVATGAEIAKRLVLFDVPVVAGSTTDVVAPLLRHGFVIAANLPIAEDTTGGLDSGTDARTTLAAAGIYVEG